MNKHLLKDKKDLGNKRTKKTKRTKRKKRNKKTRRIYKKKILRGGSATVSGKGEGVDGAGTGLSNKKSPVFHLEMHGRRGKIVKEEWKVIEMGPIHSDLEERNFEDLRKISFQTFASTGKLGRGTYGDVLMGTITELELIEGAEQTPQIPGGLQVGGEYAIKLMAREVHNYPENEFRYMKEIYEADPNLFLRPHLLLQNDEDSYAIVMELGGKSLYDYLGEETEPFRIEDLKRHVGDLAVAIATIHSLGYIHNDLKPKNILLVDKDGHLQLKLIDFGSTCKTGGEEGRDVPLLCCCKPLYNLEWVQPETLDVYDDSGGVKYTESNPGVKVVGRAADWWAFGIIILQLVGYLEQWPPEKYFSFKSGKSGKLKGACLSMLSDLNEKYLLIFEETAMKGRGLFSLADRWNFYNESPEDRKDLLKFAFYFLDPVSRTRPFLRLGGDTKTEEFETREEEKARGLQGLVNKLFPKFRVDVVPGAVSSG